MGNEKGKIIIRKSKILENKARSSVMSLSFSTMTISDTEMIDNAADDTTPGIILRKSNLFGENLTVDNKESIKK